MTDSSTQSKLTRYTTEAERENIAGVELKQGDVDAFLDKVRNGLISAGMKHDSAVQDNMALSAEVTIRLGRPVRAADGTIEEVVGRSTVTGDIEGAKVFLDPAKAPKVD